MKLRFKSKYLSIDTFETIEMPEFIVLTGVNGSGKSHLIQAIVNQKVVVEGLPTNPVIVQFNYETFKLENESTFNAQQLAQERESAWNFHQSNIRPQASGWRKLLGENYKELKASCDREQRSLWNLTKEPINAYRQQVVQFFRGRNLLKNNQANSILSMAKKLPYAIDEIDKEDFIQRYKPFNYKNDFLPLQLGKIFWDYHIRYSTNKYHKFLNETEGKTFDVLSEEKFEKLYGRKPWVIINEILATFESLKYRVNSPEGLDIFGYYQLKLEHVDKPGLLVDFSNLSSGERILMALVASVYKSSSDQYFPDLLLLDEVDASLHPSMMRNMLDVIEAVFLKNGVKVLLVSHSPTTLALTPESSVFIMNRSGPKRIEKKSKEEALKILTEGFATIDQGLSLFDEIARTPVTLVTEGHNAKILRRAFELWEVEGVEIVDGVEHISGKNQLKTLFDFLSKTNHQNKAVFVWDCDVSFKLQETNLTYPYIIARNTDNSLARKGIENAFPEHLFEGLVKTITLANGNEIREFDESQKATFAERICKDTTREDFQHFQEFIHEIERIKQQT